MRKSYALASLLLATTAFDVNAQESAFAQNAPAPIDQAPLAPPQAAAPQDLGAAPAYSMDQPPAIPSISALDNDRIARLEEAKSRALGESLDAPVEIRAAIDSVLGPEPRPISEPELLGDWQCRFIKLGGLAAAVMYDWFECRVRNTEHGLYFEKLRGSQRISGYLEPYGEGYVLIGALSVQDAPQNRYSGGREGGAGNLFSTNDQVGILSSIGINRARIEFPYPHLESVFDILELRR
jgi:hypothetical protein